MPLAHSTPTATDALADRRAIQAENALHVQERDRSKQEHEYWAAALAAVKAELAARRGAHLTEDEVQALVMKGAQDKLEEKRAEHARLDIAIPTLRNQVVTLNLARTAEEARVAEVKRNRKDLEDAAAKEAADHTTLRAERASERERLNSEVAAAEGRLATTNKTIADAEEALRKREEAAAELERGNAVKGRDLAIYEDRIRKAAAQLDPPMIINL